MPVSTVSTIKIPHHNPLRLLNVEPNWKNELSDCATSIDELLKKLDLCATQVNITPYYLHLLDPVKGARNPRRTA